MEGGLVQISHLESIKEDVTFKLQPDKDPTGKGYTLVGTGTLTLVGPNTTPPAPNTTSPSPQIFSFGPDSMAKLKLEKGFKWKVKGTYTEPQGYVEKTVVEFNTQNSNTIMVPCELKVLLKLKVEANKACTVTVSKDGGEATSGSTTLVDGKNVFVTTKLNPGSYKITGYIGNSDGSKSAGETTIVEIGTGIEKVVTIEV